MAAPAGPRGWKFHQMVVFYILKQVSSCHTGSGQRQAGWKQRASFHSLTSKLQVWATTWQEKENTSETKTEGQPETQRRMKETHLHVTDTNTQGVINSENRQRQEAESKIWHVRMSCDDVKLQNCFMNYKTSPDSPSAWRMMSGFTVLNWNDGVEDVTRSRRHRRHRRLSVCIVSDRMSATNTSEAQQRGEKASVWFGLHRNTRLTFHSAGCFTG